MRSIYIIFCVLFSGTLVSPAFGQEAKGLTQTTLRGVVSSLQDGKAIEGASVTVDKKHARTDKEGRFSISVDKPTGILTIKHIGYKEQRVAYANTATLLSIRLQPNEKQIEEVEVVSTGYQKIPKERATGSFVQINSELFNRRVGSSVMERLDGIAPGLQFDNRTGRPVVNIRGINTLRDNALGPLIIVDNFPYEGEIDNINPDNVESVTLLKDAAAASIWGARAANGVIVITLKKPLLNDKMRLSFNTNASVLEKPDLYYYSKMSTSDFINVERMLFDKGFYSTQLNGANKKFYVISPVVSLLDQADKGLINRQEAETKIDALRNMDYRDDMMEHIYRTGLNQRYGLDWSGSTGKLGYIVSLGYDRNQNTLIRSSNDRLNLRLSNSYRLLDNLELRTSVAMTNRNTSSGGGNLFPINPGGGKTNLYPYAKLVDEFGNNLAIPNTYNQDYIRNTGNGQLLDWEYRPVDDLYDETRFQNTKHLALGMDVDYSLFDLFKISVQYNLENQLGAGGTLYDEDSYYMRNTINRFTQVSNNTVKHIVPLGASLISSNNSMVSQRIRGQLSFDRVLGTKNMVTAFAGAELSDKYIKSNSTQVYGYNPQVLTSSFVDFQNSYPIYDGLSSARRIPNAQDFDGAIARFVSFYMNGAYTYDTKYIFSVSARKDASNSFGTKTNTRWNPLWSAGVGYIVSNEKFVKNMGWINHLKLKGTLGYTGNSGGGNVKPLIIYNGSPAAYTNLSYAWLLAPPNPYLKWEVVQMINYGVDFSLLNRRISGTVEVFHKKSMDLISLDPIDPTTGFSTVTSNVAEIKGNGFDVQLNAAISNKAIRWNASIGLSHVKDVVTKYFGAEMATTSIVSGSGRNLSPIKDNTFYAMYSYKFKGLDPSDGSPIGFLNGVESKDYASILRDSIQNLVYHGSALPPYYGFLRNSFNWKGIDLSFSIAFKFGAYFRKQTISYSTLYANWASHGDFDKRWQKPGDELTTSVPSMVFPADGRSDSFYGYSSENVLRADLIRLQDLRIGYNWVTPMGKMKFNGFFAVNNLGLIWTANKVGIDPDYNNLPRSRTFSVGVRADF
ncbi:MULTISPECIES: SusC/RagA family TonB-linked outer membrane protein [Sphingobacterium]|uniref:SusC/RagA family TonB-linked outer membrane protein n=1 Tax=Sphingobacterium TaxID=28453 RepID=UPI0013DC67EA|nr:MULTISPECIES: SusC/RagA family TonB-linked outer membrane protein [unclassified Sphingobacterium]